VQRYAKFPNHTIESLLLFDFERKNVFLVKEKQFIPVYIIERRKTDI
jgi:hypothetical protein